MTNEERMPIETVLPGMELHPMPPEWTPIEAFVLIKCLTEDGEPTWSYRTTAVPNRHELLGVLDVQAALIRKELVDEWEVEE